jgi:hypothetical protein
VAEVAQLDEQRAEPRVRRLARQQVASHLDQAAQAHSQALSSKKQ